MQKETSLDALKFIDEMNIQDRQETLENIWMLCKKVQKKGTSGAALSAIDMIEDYCWEFIS